METTKTLHELIDLVGNKVFSAKFVKKDGTKRDIVARLGVKKHLKGGSLAFDAKSRGLLPVFDMQKKQYRMINVNTLISVKFQGIEYKLDKGEITC